MLLKTFTQSPLRLFAGGVSALAMVVAGCAATADYGYAADEKENRFVEKRTTSKTVIESDAGETLEIEGAGNVSKIEVMQENDERTVRIYDRDGKLVSENIYGPGEKLPFEDVVIKKEDGTEQKIRIASTNGDVHRMMFIGKGGGEKGVAMPGVPVIEGDVRIMKLLDDDDLMVFDSLDGDAKLIELHKAHKIGGSGMAYCGGDDGSEQVMLEWKDEDGDENEKTVSHTVICLTGEDADPEKRAEALRKAIAHMEENAKKEEARRKKTIEALREQLRELEAEKK